MILIMWWHFAPIVTADDIMGDQKSMRLFSVIESMLINGLRIYLYLCEFGNLKEASGINCNSLSGGLNDYE